MTTDVTSSTRTPASGPEAAVAGESAGEAAGEVAADPAGDVAGDDGVGITGHNGTRRPGVRAKAARRHNGVVALTYRFATDSSGDIDAIVALVESAYRGDTSRQGWTTEADLLDGQRTDAPAVRALIAAGPGEQRALLVALDGSDFVGCCHLERRGPGEAYFGMFAVRPDGQGRGRGGAILAEAERIAREWGADTLTMTVIRQRDDLIAWYERRGYRRTGQTRPFPYGDPRYGLPTRSDLEFIVLAKPLP
jgi:GNAT superfamily N-acetyltransferase